MQRYQKNKFFKDILKRRKKGETFRSIGKSLGVSFQWCAVVVNSLGRPKNIYAGLKQRCGNKKNKDYKYYGGRGVKCEWKNFKEFWGDMEDGYKAGLTIDRVNPKGDYCKDNCRWATRRQQVQNRVPSNEWERKSPYWRHNKLKFSPKKNDNN